MQTATKFHFAMRGVAREVSPVLMNLGIEAKSAILVARPAERNPRVEVVLQFDGRILRLGHVRGEGHEQVAGYALLNGDASTGVLLVVSQFGIDRKLRDACDLLQSAGHLTANLRRN